MASTPLADLIAALQISLEKAEQLSPGGFMLVDLKLDFPAVLGTLGNQVTVELPEPGSEVEIPAQYLSRVSLTLSAGPTAPGALPLEGSPEVGLWSAISTGTAESLYDLWISAAGIIYVVGTGGVILHSGDGLTFGPATSPSGRRLYTVWGSGSGDVSAAGRKGYLTRMASPAGGWSVVPSDIDKDINAIWGDGSGRMYAVGAKGLLLASEDNGKTWQSKLGLTSGNKHGVWGTHEHIFVVGAEGHIERVIAQTFEVTQVWSSSRRLHGIWAANPEVVYAVGEQGTIVRSKDGGQSWVGVPSGTSQQLYAVWGRGPFDIYAVGRGGTILRSIDGGDTWIREESSTTESLHAVDGAADGIYAVGTKGAMVRKRV